MGFFSDIFGGGGSSSTSTSVASTTNVTTQTDIYIPLDELAEAIKNASLSESELTALQIKQNELLKNAELEQSALFEMAELEQKEKMIKFAIYFVAIAGGIYYFKKRRK